MPPEEIIRPFRWDVTRRSQLGSLPAVDVSDPYPEFEEDLLACSARVLAFAGDSDLVFVGRSPHALFDLLSGLLLDTSWQERLRLLNVSLRRVESPDQDQLHAIRPYLAEAGFGPHGLARRGRPLALVDVVDTGETFGLLLQFVKEWCDEASVEWHAVARKIRIVGLTWREKTSPKTWRWQQHAEWVERLRPSEIKNVSLPPRLATYLAAEAPKTSQAFTPSRWSDEDVTKPARQDEAREALALAVRLFDLGRVKDARLSFARALAREPAMTERWFRSLILEIRR
jgi:hypoxanthine phosphoribosyltransferase